MFEQSERGGDEKKKKKKKMEAQKKKKKKIGKRIFDFSLPGNASPPTTTRCIFFFSLSLSVSIHLGRIESAAVP
jgi:hypothetical protein